jgi:hypothetical protein
MSDKEEKKSSEVPKPPREEKDKHNALLAGVIFFMSLIIILGVLNTKSVFKNTEKSEPVFFDVDKFSREFEKSFNEAGEKINELKKIEAVDLEKYRIQYSVSSSTATSTIKK